MAKTEQEKPTEEYGYAPLRNAAEEQPPVTIETVQEGVPAEQAPLDPQTMPPGMVGTVADSARAAASAEDDPNVETAYTIDKAGNVTEVKTRLGYMMAPLPAGSRMATDEEIAKYKASQTS